MFLELIATFIAGFAAAGVAMALRMVLRGRLPSWMTPVAAGAAMIAFTIWSEYTWADRTAGTLPDGVVVVERVAQSIAYKPWTYLAPQTTRLIAVDQANAQTNEAHPDTRLVDLYLFARWQPPAQVAQLIDCATPARADVTDAALSDPAAAQWLPMAADDAMIRTVCP